jgi:hypothetical protein
MMGEVRFLPCKCVVGHDPDEEDCRSPTYIVFILSFCVFCNILSDCLLLVVAVTMTKRKGHLRQDGVIMEHRQYVCWLLIL